MFGTLGRQLIHDPSSGLHPSCIRMLLILNFSDWKTHLSSSALIKFTKIVSLEVVLSFVLESIVLNFLYNLDL